MSGVYLVLIWLRLLLICVYLMLIWLRLLLIWCLFGAYLCLFDAYFASSAALLTTCEQKCIFSKMGMSQTLRHVYFSEIKAPAGAT